jgi:hypothetical protein
MDTNMTEAAPGHIDLHRGTEPTPPAPAGEEGSTTAEFAIVTLAAVAFAGLLVSILSSGDVRGLLMGLIRQALSF